MKRIGVVGILILAFCGIANAAYLTQSEITGTPLICNIQSLSGCNIVANSQYSQLFGIPLAEYGVLFYAILFVLAALELVLFDQLLRRVLQGISFIGVLASLYFTTVQVLFIGAFCIYCLASSLIALSIFILATLIEPLGRGKMQSPDHSAPASPKEGPAHLSMPPTA